MHKHLSVSIPCREVGEGNVKACQPSFSPSFSLFPLHRLALCHRHGSRGARIRKGSWVFAATGLTLFSTGDKHQGKRSKVKQKLCVSLFPVPSASCAGLLPLPESSATPFSTGQRRPTWPPAFIRWLSSVTAPSGLRYCLLQFPHWPTTLHCSPNARPWRSHYPGALDSKT